MPVGSVSHSAATRVEPAPLDTAALTVSSDECAVFSATIRDLMLSDSRATVVLVRERTIEGVRDAIPLTQRQLVDHLGVDREFMSILAERWERPGILHSCLELGQPYKLLGEEEVGRVVGYESVVLRKTLYYRYPGSTALVGMTRPAISDDGKKAILYFETWWGGSVVYLFHDMRDWKVLHNVKLWQQGMQPEVP